MINFNKKKLYQVTLKESKFPMIMVYKTRQKIDKITNKKTISNHNLKESKFL